MNETQAPFEPQAPALVDTIGAKVDQLADDADYLASMDRTKLSPEDQAAFDALVEARKADYQANADAIRARTNALLRKNNADLQERINSEDHNIR